MPQLHRYCRRSDTGDTITKPHVLRKHAVRIQKHFQQGTRVTNKHELHAKTLVLGKASLRNCWMTKHYFPQCPYGRQAVLTRTKNATYITVCCLRLSAPQIATVSLHQCMKFLHELSDFQSLPALALHT